MDMRRKPGCASRFFLSVLIASLLISGSREGDTGADMPPDGSANVLAEVFLDIYEDKRLLHEMLNVCSEAFTSPQSKYRKFLRSIHKFSIMVPLKCVPWLRHWNHANRRKSHLIWSCQISEMEELNFFCIKATKEEDEEGCGEKIDRQQLFACLLVGIINSGTTYFTVPYLPRYSSSSCIRCPCCSCSYICSRSCSSSRDIYRWGLFCITPLLRMSPSFCVPLVFALV